MAGCPHQETEETRRPNILFAISDDRSFGHTSFESSGFVNTPAFDRMASAGIFFTSAIAPSPGCAPSRSALVTGHHHWQNEQSGQHGSSWMKEALMQELIRSEDPRVVGPDKDIFDSYPRYMHMREYPEPGWMN